MIAVLLLILAALLCAALLAPLVGALLADMAEDYPEPVDGQPLPEWVASLREDSVLDEANETWGPA